MRARSAGFASSVADRRAEPVGVAAIDQKSGLPVDDDLRQRAAAGGHDRQACSHRLDHRNAERLVPQRRKHENAGLGVVCADVRVEHAAVQSRRSPSCSACLRRCSW